MLADPVDPVDPTGPAPAGRLTVRPRRMRMVCWSAAAAVVVIFAAITLTLPSSGSDRIVTTPNGQTSVGLADRIGIFGVGVAVAVGLLWLARARLEATPDGLRIRNIVGHYQVPWGLVRAVSFRDGAPWATLELAADEQIALMAVQAVDGDRTVAAVRALRALHRASTDRSHRAERC
ncbi:MAG: PH domain-containing protein [Actinobacteria bacterium]|nr:PH domain-containing protein [Actinomycetota bacterium]MBI3687690.1 PH domain-containing protein [Actinomycetota bacterium]